MLELMKRGRLCGRNVAWRRSHSQSRNVAKTSPRLLSLLFCLGVAWVATPLASAAQHADGELEINVVDADTHQPIAARMHVKTARGKELKLKLAGLNQYADHFYIDGRITLPFAIGRYVFELEAGPEYKTQNGHFEIERHADDSKTIEMHRFADLAKEGWWSGDLDVMRPLAVLPLAMKAENLNVVPVTAWQNVDGKWSAVTEAAPKSTKSDLAEVSRVFGNWAELDQRVGGGLLMFNLPQPIDLSAATLAEPSSLNVLKDSKKAAEVHVVARTPYAWDLPVWLASGKLDAIELVNQHVLRSGAADDEQDGRPPDPLLFPGRTGSGHWSETIYYHVLNCGLRVPPGAGSGSGTNDNPIGFSRVYVYCGDEFSYTRWWEGLEAGRVFVTNGPLLRPMVEGQPPGYDFSLEGREQLKLEIGLNLATREPIDYLQIIKNGEVDTEVRLADFDKTGGRLPPVVFDESGWFLIRAVTNNAHTYQLASSGPYYVEKDGRPRVSRKSVQFFLEWIDARVGQLRAMAELDESTRSGLLAEQASARRFFEDLLAKANAE
jgi:hypothetical protein